MSRKKDIVNVVRIIAILKMKLVLLKCPIYNSLRSPFITSLKTKFVNLDSLSDENVFTWLLSSEDKFTSCLLAKFIHEAFTLRESHIYSSWVKIENNRMIYMYCMLNALLELVYCAALHIVTPFHVYIHNLFWIFACIMYMFCSFRARIAK